MTEQPKIAAVERLEEIVRDAVAGLSELGRERITSRPNCEKYTGSLDGDPDESNLSEVFALMGSLNERAISNPRLGSDNVGARSFRDRLGRFAADIIEAMQGRPFTYVELGPEPIKTGFLINRLRAYGANLQDYIGVDINPASAPHMREALAELLDPARVTFRLKDFADLEAADIHAGDRASVITMFGFQEGNEHPATIADRLSRIALSSDLIASEMHVADAGPASDVAAFYATPEMRRFSRIAFERMVGDLPSRYRVYTPSVAVDLDQPALACVTAEEFDDPGDGETRLALTNWCLKPSVHQMRVARRKDNRIDVQTERLTGDGGVLFQLATVRDVAVTTPAAPAISAA